MNAVLQGATPYEVTTDPSATRLKIMSTDGVTGLWFDGRSDRRCGRLRVGLRFGRADICRLICAVGG